MKKPFKVSLIILVVVAIAISLAPSRQDSLTKVVNRFNAKYMEKAPYDAIIVPGYPYESKSYPELFTTRLFFAKELYESGVAHNIIFSGAAVHTPYTEGKVMKIFSEAMGIPAEHTFVESEALHSWQNVKYGKKLAKKLGFKKIAVATDPYQLSYLRLLAPGMPILSFQPDTPSMRHYIQPLPEVDVSPAFVKDFIPLNER
ncbi:MAG: YdcF family protein [Bacteroidetes bacterium]|nr:YdcF family protein [Bacteroidota bacterium]